MKYERTLEIIQERIDFHNSFIKNLEENLETVTRDRKILIEELEYALELILAAVVKDGGQNV